MNLDNIYAPKEGSSFIPAPLSLKRNGFGSELNYERDDGILGQGSSFCPDSDVSGKYFAASIRKGPFMTKQEDRVSYLKPIFKILTFFSFVVFIQRKFPRKQHKFILLYIRWSRRLPSCSFLPLEFVKEARDTSNAENRAEYNATNQKR